MPAAADLHPDVVIVGAGPTGLMAATLLRRAGVTVLIFDKSAHQAQESRAFAVHAQLARAAARDRRRRRLHGPRRDRDRGAGFVDGRRVAEIDFATSRGARSTRSC
jgi:2-polyprenyl-6-methoxyphenol hydroxylase-like FAD-dependent oxidoreductase